MTENEAEAWLADKCGNASIVRLRQFVEMLKIESGRQNLIAASTVPSIWGRHIVDSAQLLELSKTSGLWVDVGTGAGLPGIVIACCSPRPIVLIEPRKLRAIFLTSVIEQIGLRHAEVIIAKVQAVTLATCPTTISARAVASLDALFGATHHIASRETEWLLPKGASAAVEQEQARRRWYGTFHVKNSVESATSQIVVARGVHKR